MFDKVPKLFDDALNMHNENTNGKEASVRAVDGEANLLDSRRARES